MNNPPDREVAVFSEARRLPADARARYLDETCAGNAELRQRVEELLQASEEAGGFLQGPAPGAQWPANASDLPDTLQIGAAGEKVGDRIGRYKLLQQIGEGGCGVVYMAEQEEPVRRRVALKVIKLGMDTRQVVARFEAERQALALMDHPNIAKVLEAGATDTGRPYFVMELVRGIKITRYCDENNLSTRERLDLFSKVAQAVQHAHQKGIIHRDIKPSNVLVADHDGVPVPKIIDFGIAKATTDQRLTDKTLFTAFEQFIGTPAYMSPEQARMSGLDIDTRTDIYSLGVLLYELLTGKTPFDAAELLAAGLDAMRRTINETEPVRPSTRLSTMLEGELTTTAKHRHTDAPKLIHLLRGDLDWIVMKALEKDRARRYETANGLAMDIQRHLNNEPVAARPPSNVYRFQKLARRNKLAFAAIAAVATALVLGVVVSTWQAIRARHAEHLAKAARVAEAEQRSEAEKQREQAQANFQRSRKTVDEYFTTISETTLLDKPGLEPLRKELLERALKYYQDLLAQQGEDPRVQAEIAGTYLRMSVVFVMLDSGDEAISALQIGLESVEKLIQGTPNDSQLQRSLAGYRNVERLLYSPRTSGPHLSDPLQGLQTLKKAGEMWQKFIQDNPTVSGFQNDLAAFSSDMGSLCYDLGRREEALQAYEKAAEIREKLVRENPESREFRAALAESRTGLGWMLQHCGRPQDAEKPYRLAVALQEQLVHEFPQVPNYRVVLANGYRSLSSLLRDTGRLPDAEKATRMALDITEKLAVDFPDVPAFELEVSMNYRELGIALAATVRPQEAEKAYHEANRARPKNRRQVPQPS